MTAKLWPLLCSVPEVPFRGFERGMPKQELDLFEIPVGLPAELGADAAKIVDVEPLDPDLFGRLSSTDHTAQSLSPLPILRAVLPDRPRQPSLIDAGPLRIGEVKDTLAHYEATTFPRNPRAGCELYLRRVDALFGLGKDCDGPIGPLGAC